MKKFYLILITVILFSCSSFAQITKTKIIEKIEIKDTSPYDSLTNFLGKDVHKYIGQNLYVLGKPEQLRFDYEGFILDYQYEFDLDQRLKDIYSRTKRNNVYKCDSTKHCFRTKYEDLEGSYFLVKNVFDHPKNKGEEYFLELEEKETKDKVYYEYDSNNFLSVFPFLVVGFYEKEKKRLIGKQFVFKNNILKSSVYGSGLDLVTGEPNTVLTGEIWKCIDLTIEEKECELSLVLENSTGKTTTIRHSVIDDNANSVYTPKEANTLISRFGSLNFKSILESKVKIGMTKEMALFSWGKPNDINKTITTNNTSEQWVYDDNYLYFEGGKLTAIQ